MQPKREPDNYTIDRLDHVVLWASDVEASVRFYEALGFDVERSAYSAHVNGGSPFVAVKIDGRTCINLRPAPDGWKPVEREKGNMQHINVTIEGVDDIALLIDEIAKHGVQPAFPPDTIGGTWRVEYYDPDNNRIELALTKILDTFRR